MPYLAKSAAVSQVQGSLGLTATTVGVVVGVVLVPWLGLAALVVAGGLAGVAGAGLWWRVAIAERRSSDSS